MTRDRADGQRREDPDAGDSAATTPAGQAQPSPTAAACLVGCSRFATIWPDPAAFVGYHRATWKSSEVCSS